MEETKVQITDDLTENEKELEKEIKEAKNAKLEKQRKLQKQKKKKAMQNDKDKYFSYYDDIKVGSHKIVDW